MWGLGSMILGCGILVLMGVALSGGDALLLDKYFAILQGVKPKPLEEDHFVWWSHKDGFWVEDYYKRICDSCSLDHIWSLLMLS